MIADVSQSAEHKRKKYQQEQTHTILTWCGEIFSGVMAAVDIPPKSQTRVYEIPKSCLWLTCGQREGHLHSCCILVLTLTLFIIWGNYKNYPASGS